MALTKTVTKLWPVKGERNIFKTGIQLVIQDDAIEVINEPFTTDYPKGTNPDRIVPDVLERAQARVDRYKAEKQINDAPAYDQAVADVDSGLVL